MNVSEKIKTKSCEIWLDNEGFLILKLDDRCEMDLEEVKDCFEAYKKLGCGPDNKVLQLIDTRGESSMTHEARTFVSEIASQFFIASAIVSNSLSIRLIVNFFNQFYKNLVPFKMFNNEAEARKWLRSFINKN